MRPRITMAVAVFLTALLSPVLTARAQRERPPELALMDPFIGTWETIEVDEETGQANRVGVTWRRWSLEGQGDTVIEENLDGNGNENSCLAWTLDPGTGLYRGVLLQFHSPSGFTGRWNAEERALEWYVMSPTMDPAEISLRVLDNDRLQWSGHFWNARGDTVFEARLEQRRIDPLPAPDAPVRPAEMQHLDAWTGTWQSRLILTGTDHVFPNESHTVWSRHGQGQFLVTLEPGAGDTERYTILGYDQNEKIFRGAFLEPTASGFIKGRLTDGRMALNCRFMLFDLPLDDRGELIPGAGYFDGLGGTVIQKIVGADVMLLSLEMNFGGTAFWSGAGEKRRPLDPARRTPLLLRSHEGQALVLRPTFVVKPGRGCHLAVGPADKAVDVFKEGGTVRLADAPEMALHVSHGKYEPGSDVIVWSPYGNAYAHQTWHLNDDGTASPGKNTDLVLGWRDDKLVLVPRDAEDRLVFAGPGQE